MQRKAAINRLFHVSDAAPSVVAPSLLLVLQSGIHYLTIFAIQLLDQSSFDGTYLTVRYRCFYVCALNKCTFTYLLTDKTDCIAIIRNATLWCIHLYRSVWRWLLSGWRARTVWWRTSRPSRLWDQRRRSAPTRLGHWLRTAWRSHTCGSTTRSWRQIPAKISPVSLSSHCFDFDFFFDAISQHFWS